MAPSFLTILISLRKTIFDILVSTKKKKKKFPKILPRKFGNVNKDAYFCIVIEGLTPANFSSNSLLMIQAKNSARSNYNTN